MPLRAAIVPVTPFMQNCTLLWDDESTAGAVVDPGGDVRRIRAGIARARSSGKRWGGRKEGVRPKLTRLTLRSIGALVKAGTPKAEIARQLRVHRSTVYEAEKLLSSKA